MSKNKLVILSDQYNITSDSTYADDRVQVLNHGDTFGIFDRRGDINPIGKGLQGLYNRDTRFISRLELRINYHRPVLLSSNIKEENEILSVDLTNPALKLENGSDICQDLLHIRRSQFVQDNLFHEKLEFENFHHEPVELEVSLHIGGDFSDIFEVKGSDRVKRGKLSDPETAGDRCIRLSYEGLDRQIRQSVISFSNPFEHADHSEDTVVVFRMSFGPHKSDELSYSISFNIGEQNGHPDEDYHVAKKRQEPLLEKTKAYLPEIETSNEQFSHWLNRSRADLVSLMATTPHGKYPYAGIPWFNTAFGRDGIITAMETLWIAPDLSRDVLKFLAAYQATETDPAADAEPGKILHETRNGEMVSCNELPFGRYYGTVDATPLFVMLAGEYYERTGDLKTIRSIWPNILAAVNWIDEYGDTDGDGFVEYHHKAENGIRNQAWKDSHDSVSHSDGRLAEPPIAMCEVQGYVYAAKLQAATLARALGENGHIEKWKKEAWSLRKKFNEVFWDEKLKSYILALDGDKKPCRVVSSNAGQVLFSGIADPTKAEKQVQTLLKPEMFTGWGVRTLSTDAERYNPMSYHNGSVWPHDVALIAHGMAKYGFRNETVQLLTGLFDASVFIPLQRMPELFCGFERRHGEAPTSYPVACSPQAWSVATVYYLLQSILRIRVRTLTKEITFHKPIMPSYLECVIIKGLAVDNASVDIEVTRHGNDSMIGVNWKNNPDGWRLLVIK